MRGQYRLGYITLRSNGLYRVRVQVDLPRYTGTLETQAIDVEAFSGPDNEGRISIDPPDFDKDQGTGRVVVRALHVPRNVTRIRFKPDTLKDFDFNLVPESEGGLLEGWSLIGPDSERFYEASSPNPLRLGSFGALFSIDVTGITEKTLEVPIEIDNSIYAEKSFAHPEIFCIGECLPEAGRIAFRSDRDGNFEIYSMNFDGSDVTNLTKNRSADLLPAWSPDGTKIAFDSNRDIVRQIFVMNDDGSDAQSLTGRNTRASLPAWSSDGQRIAFDFDLARDGNRDVYVMDSTGGNQVRVTSDPADDWWASWSPDGNQIAFTSRRDGNAEIYVTNADGTGIPVNLTNHGADDFRPGLVPRRRQDRLLLPPRWQPGDLSDERGWNGPDQLLEPSCRRLVPRLVPGRGSHRVHLDQRRKRRDLRRERRRNPSPKRFSASGGRPVARLGTISGNRPALSLHSRVAQSSRLLGDHPSNRERCRPSRRRGDSIVRS